MSTRTTFLGTIPTGYGATVAEVQPEVLVAIKAADRLAEDRRRAEATRITELKSQGARRARAARALKRALRGWGAQ
jgi:hypothetical protein